ncbi:hypothetical protein [Geodermatophilus sp. FMUSA9-8]|uniref:hypothetical protein n=1 Tax=Geodermatophilus sp. FMUSA9-8 TaxID=3120155 RepID=UPI00300867A0
MPVTQAITRPLAAVSHGEPDPAPPNDNRPVYLAWGAAWLVGYGAMALDGSFVLDLPSIVPPVLLAVGLLAAAVVTGLTTARAQRGASPAAKAAGTMIGAAWVIAFTALFVMITALDRVLEHDHLQTVIWPAGSAFVVGLLYLAGGAVTGDRLQYALGSWLAIIGTAAVFLDTPGLYAVLAIAGTGGYGVAAALEPRRLTNAASPRRSASA